MAGVTFLDVDKTLLDGYSGFFTALHLMRAGALRKRHLPKAIFYKIISKLYKGNVRKMYDVVLADIAGWTLEDIMAIGRRCFEQDLRPRLYQEGIDLVEHHRQAGDALYFVTSGPYMTIQILGEFLKVNADYAPGPMVQEGILQRALKEPLPYLSGKLEVGKLIAEKEGVSLDDCFFYTDNIDDLSLLEAVGHPHVVNPDRPLARLARRRQWPILHFHRTLQSHSAHLT